jgi:hypothetical protein
MASGQGKQNFTAKAAKATKMNFLSQFFAAFVAFVVKFSFVVSRVRTSVFGCDSAALRLCVFA